MNSGLPDWNRDEVVLAFELYKRVGMTTKRMPEVIQLSQLLRRYHELLGRQFPSSFRSANSVHLKICNLAKFDPSWQKKTLTNGSAKLEQSVWLAFDKQPALLSQTALAIRSALEAGLERSASSIPNIAETIQEGGLLLVLHRIRERNPKAREAKLKEAQTSSRGLRCEACNHSPLGLYGELGDILECHHRVPLAEATHKRRITTKDLALLCPNCHRAIHKTSPLCSVDDFRERIHKNKPVVPRLNN